MYDAPYSYHFINTHTHTYMGKKMTDMIRFMVLNATFNNISVIWWWLVLLVEETGVPGENHQTVASHRQSLT